MERLSFLLNDGKEVVFSRRQSVHFRKTRAGSHIADYDRASGKFLRFLETMDGKQPGDPEAAEAIIAAIESTRRRCGSSSANTQTTKCAENLRQPKQNSLPIGLSADYAYTP